MRWLLAKGVGEFGDRRLGELRSQEIAAWRMTVAPGHRFEATQALRQVLARAVAWGMIDVNPAKQGVDNPQRRRTEKRPFESWAQLAAVASKLGECSGALVMFAAATGLRPGEWIALERRDIDRDARVVYVRRAYRNGRLKCTKTEGSVRAVPLQGDDSVAPAATACWTTLSGSSTTSSVRLVAPSIARGLCRFIVADVAATQNAASPMPSWATMSSPSPTRVKDGCTECGFVERDRFTRSLDPQLRLDTRHRVPPPFHQLRIFVQRGGQPATYSPRVA
jgi:hypothetical protein